MSTKQLRQAITPTHILGSTGVAEGSDLGYQSIPNFAANIQPELRATQGEAQIGTGNDKFLTPLRVRDVFVGTVSQSGGVPTGAIIERGSNANGEYVRYADGTQICTRVVATRTVNVTNTGTTSGVLFSDLFSLTFAASFSSVPAVEVFLSVGNIMWACGSSVSSTGHGYIFAAASPEPSRSASEHIIAIGRWF